MLTFQDWGDPTGQTKTSKFIIEYFVAFECSCSTISDFNACCKAVKDAVPPQQGMTLCANQHTSLCITKNVILLQNT